MWYTVEKKLSDLLENIYFKSAVGVKSEISCFALICEKKKNHELFRNSRNARIFVPTPNITTPEEHQQHYIETISSTIQKLQKLNRLTFSGLSSQQLQLRKFGILKDMNKVFFISQLKRRRQNFNEFRKAIILKFNFQSALLSK